MEIRCPRTGIAVVESAVRLQLSRVRARSGDTVGASAELDLAERLSSNLGLARLAYEIAQVRDYELPRGALDAHSDAWPSVEQDSSGAEGASAT